MLLLVDKLILKQLAITKLGREVADDDNEAAQRL